VVPDYLVRSTAARGAVRAICARTTETVAEARRRHGTSPTATAALGRALTAAALLAATLKDGQSVTLRIIGDGPLGGIVAHADATGAVRGYVRSPDTHLPLTPEGKLDVGGAVGRSGFVHVARDYGLKEPYTGSSALVSGEIAEDMASYMTRSEQVPSAVALGVLVDKSGVRSAGGLLLQVLPGSPRELLEELDESVRGMGSASRLIDEGRTPERIVREVLGPVDPVILEKRPIGFRCRCRRETVRELVGAVGRDELMDMMREGSAEVVCRFCGERYDLGADELKRLAERSERGHDAPPAGGVCRT